MWVSYLTRLGRQYHARGVAGLFVHDFRLQAGEIVDASATVSAKRLQLYATLARHNPWTPIMWSKPVGTAIFPDESNVYTRASQNNQPFVKALIRYKKPIGMGAILWKDKHQEPQYVFALAILRPGQPEKGDAFTKEEKSLFASEIPILVKDIQNHDYVIKIRSGMNGITERKPPIEVQTDVKGSN